VFDAMHRKLTECAARKPRCSSHTMANTSDRSRIEA
jgi:hypothetical protein